MEKLCFAGYMKCLQRTLVENGNGEVASPLFDLVLKDDDTSSTNSQNFLACVMRRYLRSSSPASAYYPGIKQSHNLTRVLLRFPMKTLLTPRLLLSAGVLYATKQLPTFSGPLRMKPKT